MTYFLQRKSGKKTGDIVIGCKCSFLSVLVDKSGYFFDF